MSITPSKTVQVIDSAVNRKDIALINGDGAAWVVLWPGNGARYRTFHILELHPNDQTVDLCHAADCVYYVVEGTGNVRDLETDEIQPLVDGAIVHIDAQDRYRLEADDGGMRLIGGPVPADPDLYTQFEMAEAE